MAQGSALRTLGPAGRGGHLADLRTRNRTGQDPHHGNLARHGLHLLCGHSGRPPRAEARSGDADLCRELRPDHLRLCPRTAGGPGLFQLDAFGGDAAPLAGHRPDPRRDAPGCRSELRLRHPHVRHVRHPVRRDDQHPGTGCRPAGAQAAGHGRQRRRAELCRDLSAGRRRCDSGHRLPAQTVRPAVGPARPRRRTPQERLHRQLPHHQSGTLRQERP